MKRKTKIDIGNLVDFSSKIVNSNSSVGIRLSSDAAHSSRTQRGRGEA